MSGKMWILKTSDHVYLCCLQIYQSMTPSVKKQKKTKTSTSTKKEPGPPSAVSKGTKDDLHGTLSSKSAGTKNPERKRGEVVPTKRKPVDVPQNDAPVKKRTKTGDAEVPAKTRAGNANQSSIIKQSSQHSALKKPSAAKSKSLIVAKPSTTKPIAKNSTTVSKNDSKSTPSKVIAKPPLPSQPESAVSENNRDEEDQGSASPSEADSHEEGNSHLHGFSSDDDDSSDEDEALDDESPAPDVRKLPTIAKDDEAVKQRLEKAKRQPNDQRGVLYLARIPHGFYEDQLKSYFSQFGEVTRLRLSRNKKSGRSKHYAFLEFDSLAVAKIVAETMDNYLLMGHILKCRLISPEQVHPNLWIGANRKWRVVPHDRVARVKHNKSRTESERHLAERRLLKRQRDRKRRIAEAGIKYDFESVAYTRKKA